MIIKIYKKKVNDFFSDHIAYVNMELQKQFKTYG